MTLQVRFSFNIDIPMTMDQLRSTKQKANEIFLLGRSIPRNGDPFCRSIPLWLALLGMLPDHLRPFLMMDPPATLEALVRDSRKDGIRRRVSRTNKIRVEKGELAKLDKIGMGIGTCIDVPYRPNAPRLMRCIPPVD
ncbi:hypothetical protein L1987_88769 [Smallanthus sonchifolius]|nr:hypothetical protein L1987_88769 [Smallanthus sonchifolius]